VEPAGQREFFNWIQCFDPSSLQSELSEAGWTLETTFGNVAGEPFDPEGQFFAVVAAPTG
jgi:hypothetical protein